MAIDISIRGQVTEGELLAIEEIARRVPRERNHRRDRITFWLPFVKPGGVIVATIIPMNGDAMKETDNIARKPRTKANVRQSHWWIKIPG